MRRLVIPVLLATLVACGGDSTTGPNASVQGNYTLQSVNGTNVPTVVYQDTEEKDELTGGNINLNSDGTWSGSLSLRATSLTTNAVATVSLPASGTYTASNGSITLTDATDGSQLVGTVTNGILTLGSDIGTGEVLTLTFRR